MIHPPIDKLLERIDSKYALVIVAAKRARQLNTYHHQLGEGNIDTFAPPMVESRSKNYLTMALEEIAQGKLHWELPERTVARSSGPCDAGRAATRPRRRHGRRRRLQDV